MDDFSFVALVAAGAFAIRMFWRRDPTAARAMWDRAARLVGGEHAIEGGEHVLRLEVDGVPLVVRTRSEAIGRHASRTTIAHATLPGAARTTLEGVPRGTAKWNAPRLLSVTLGRPDVPTGDVAFDGAFRVSSSPEALASELFDARARRHLLEAREGFVVERGELRIEREGVPTEIEPLLALVRFARGVVRAWNDVVRGPERIARALEWIVEPDVTFDAEADALVARGVRRGVTCELVVRFREAWALVVVRVASASPSTCSVVRDADSSSGWTGAVPEPLRPLTLAAPRQLVGIQQTHDALELAFDGLDVEPAAVVAALDVTIEAIAAPQPYR